MKNAEAVALANAIAAIQQQGTRAPALFGFGLAINVKRLAPVVESFDEQRKKLAEQFSEKDADGSAVVVTAEGGMQSYKIADEEGFARAFTELSEGTVSVDLHMIPLSVFPEQIEPVLVGMLLPIIETPKEQTSA